MPMVRSTVPSRPKPAQGRLVRASSAISRPSATATKIRCAHGAAPSTPAAGHALQRQKHRATDARTDHADAPLRMMGYVECWSYPRARPRGAMA